MPSLWLNWDSLWFWTLAESFKLLPLLFGKIRYCQYRVKPQRWRKIALHSKNRTPLIKNTGFFMSPTQLTRTFLWFWILPESFRLLWLLFGKIRHCQYRVKPQRWRKITLRGKNRTPLLKNTGFLMPPMQLTRAFYGFEHVLKVSSCCDFYLGRYGTVNIV